MGYKVFQVADRERWTARAGLEGPFFYRSGRVLYYDAKAGQYYDPTTDMYVPNDEVQRMVDSGA